MTRTLQAARSIVENRFVMLMYRAVHSAYSAVFASANSRLKLSGGWLVILCAVAAGAVADGDTPALEANDCTPAGELRGDAARGEALHLEHCAGCHGADGRAEVIVMHMDVPPRDQTDAEYMRTMADAYIYIAICKGGEAVGKSIVMPGWGDVLTDQDIKDLVAQVRSFSGT